MANLPRVTIHADESCLGNQFQDRPSRGGAAGLVEHWTGETWERRDYWISDPATTNNRMALWSAIEGLACLKQRCRVRFVSDSQYLVRGMQEWVPGWKARGWKRKGGKIENLELWKKLDEMAGRHVLRWGWVRGHAGDPRNEYVNHLAVRAAREGSSSGGLVNSAFGSWLQERREKWKQYLDFSENQSPDEVDSGG